MTSIVHSAVKIQTSPDSKPSTPSWLGEVTMVAHYLRRVEVLEAIEQRVRFARGRFGKYEVSDFVAVLIGYALSGERTLQAFYERLQPFATPFMALFGRTHLPHRSTLSRFLAALDQATVEALRTLFTQDLLARPLSHEQPGGLFDRQGGQWLVFDVDGTRQAARQRAVPQTPDVPAARRRMQQVCAKGYLGRKRGEVVRTRTTVLQAHTHQWLATISAKGNGEYRGELLLCMEAIAAYLVAQQMALAQGVVRLDGLYGNGAIVADLEVKGLCYLMRSKDYHLLDRPEVQARLAAPPDQQTTHPETGTCQTLFDCPDLLLYPTGLRTRLIVATHQASHTTAPIGVTRQGVVYELFCTALPVGAFAAADVVDLYLHRGAFETVLADEDQEQATDRWCSQTPCGQDCWQILNQWVWNLRLELGHRLHRTDMRLTEFAAAQTSAAVAPLVCDPTRLSCQAAAQTSPPVAPLLCDPTRLSQWTARWARAKRLGGIGGHDFRLQDDGSLRCPADEPLYRQEQRRQPDGSLRVRYAAGIGSCRPCPLRERCQGPGQQTQKPRRVSLVLWPVHSMPVLALEPLLVATGPPAAPAGSPILWGDWSRCRTRRQWMALLRSQSVTLTPVPVVCVALVPPIGPLTRAQRAHRRLSWDQRLARNACLEPVTRIRLWGIPSAFATALGLPSQA